MASITSTPDGPVSRNESKIFNNDKDFDIIIRFGEHKFHAHRIILRVMSPFFDRALTSQFSVAQNPVFELGDEDNPEAVWAMFKHIYDLNFAHDRISRPAAEFRDNMPEGIYYSDDGVEYLQTDPEARVKELRFYVDVFIVADKYDCPSLRQKVSSHFATAADMMVEFGHYQELVTVMSRICGPNAPQIAASELREEVVNLCLGHFKTFTTEKTFVQALVDGELFADPCTSRLLVFALDNIYLARNGGRKSNPGQVALILQDAASRMIPKQRFT